MPTSFGKTLIIVGVALVVIGGLFLALSKLGLGKLPGDISFQRGNFTFSFPIMTSILVSIVLTIVLNLLLRK